MRDGTPYNLLNIVHVKSALPNFSVLYPRRSRFLISSSGGSNHTSVALRVVYPGLTIDFLEPLTGRDQSPVSRKSLLPCTTAIALAILTRPCPDSLLGTKLEAVGPKMLAPLMSSALISAALGYGGGIADEGFAEDGRTAYDKRCGHTCPSFVTPMIV